MTNLSLALPAFVAGILTFLAPCTLPLVPGYLGFISGVSLTDLKDSQKAARVRRRVFLNGLFYVIGFSVVFVVLGTLIGLIGGALFAQSRQLAARVGGLFVILFGVIMLVSALSFYEDRWPWLRYFRFPFLDWFARERRLPAASIIKPGNPVSSTLFGAVFAIGWTPCVGPVLGAILTLAATGASVGQGALLLGIFSLGLAVPFLMLAGGIGAASRALARWGFVLPALSAVGGAFIIFLGVLVATNRLGTWIALAFRWFGFLEYEQLLQYL